MERRQHTRFDAFYRAFEYHHRGPRDLIKHRLGVYRAFIEPLRQIYDWWNQALVFQVVPGNSFRAIGVNYLPTLVQWVSV